MKTQKKPTPIDIPTETEVRTQLKKLRVRPGLQRTTWVISEYPWTALDMFYDREASTVCLRLSWGFTKQKTITVPDSETKTAKHCRWITEATIRLTDEAIDRLAPGLASVLSRILQAQNEQEAKAPS